jgi:carbon storage regulator
LHKAADITQRESARNLKQKVQGGSEAMLILSRKVGEKIVIGDGITVVVSRVSGDRVTLGLEAPPEVRILRGELSPFDKRSAEPLSSPTVVGRHTERRDRAFQSTRVARPAR